MSRSLDRRQFLKLSGTTLCLLGGGGLSALAESFPRTASSGRGGVLVVFFQRGAADGLHMVIPYRDGRYRSLRGALALPEPGRGEQSPSDLGDGFAMHPALSDLKPLYASGKLAWVHAVGSPDGTRSHFDAQDYMESGTPGDKGTRDGWLARAVTALDSTDSAGRTPFRAIALASTMPRSLAGANHALAMADFARMKAPTAATTSIEERIARMYEADASPAFAAAGDEAFEALKVFREKDPLGKQPRAGARYPRGRTGQAFRQVAALVKADLGVRIASVEGGGWDTHFNQGAATGAMANEMRELSGSIAAFLTDVGSDVPVTILTATEFGRTVRVNGSGGSDHGHGSAMMVAGHGVRGGRVAGSWSGLGDLYEGRDLPVTTDFRDLFGEVAAATLGLPGAVELFPGWKGRGRLSVVG